MVDKDRILAKLDQLEGYLQELRQILPESFKEHHKMKKKTSLREDSANCHRGDD